MLVSNLLAAFVEKFSHEHPIEGLIIGERDEPTDRQDWTTITVKASTINHHDIWSLRGVGLDESNLPMILGCDCSGIDADGNEVIVHSVIGDPMIIGSKGDETFDPNRSLLSERYNGTLAEKVSVPKWNILPKPPEISFEEAACLPTAWLTAYRMLVRDSNLSTGDKVLIQGAGGGVASAAIILAKALGMEVWITSRDEVKRRRALDLGADRAYESGERLDDRVDCVIETVGKATWSHSLKSLRPGGTVVVSGATSGDDPSADLKRVFFRQLRVIGSTMGSKSELLALTQLVAKSNIHPPIEAVIPLAQARRGFELLESGDVFGKIVVLP